MKKKFVFVLRETDGSEYEKVVSANNEVEAERKLKDVLEIFNSRDKIIRLKQS
jgi:hypothetical protein